MSKPYLKAPDEVKIMKEGGGIAAAILDELLRSAEVGVQTIDLERMAIRLIHKYKVESVFKGFQGYQYNLVTCINDEVIHGLPSMRVLKDKDLLTLDFGIRHRGFCVDMAKTKAVGEDVSQERLDFLAVGERALGQAIKNCVPGCHLGDIGHAIQSTIESQGYNVIRAFVGHGIGKSLHEPPQIPCFGNVGEGLELETGMVLAVEVMYAAGSYEVEVLDDGWTVVTADGFVSAMFEHTVAITDYEPLVLTQYVA